MELANYIFIILLFCWTTSGSRRRVGAVEEISQFDVTWELPPWMRPIYRPMPKRLPTTKAPLTQNKISITPENLKLWNHLYSELFKKVESTNSNSSSRNKLPNLTYISRNCPPNSFFYSYSPKHWKAVEDLGRLIMRNAYKTIEKKLARAKALRQSQEVHPKVWYYAITTVSLHDPTFQNIVRPIPVEVMPDVFINAETILKAEKNQIPNHCVPLWSNTQSGGVENDGENSLWYFREDIQLNTHNWYWNLKYSKKGYGKADRQGELYYYAHQTILARYDAERLSNGLSRLTAIPISNQESSIPEPYFPHLRDTLGRNWTDRTEDVQIWDILHDENPDVKKNIRLMDLMLLWNYFMDGIVAKRIKRDDGQSIMLDDTNGINILGEFAQRGGLRLYFKHFGNYTKNINDYGHLIIALAMDPNFTNKTTPGPMGDFATELRDVISYRWHMFVNDIFEYHKYMDLNPYNPHGELALTWPGVNLETVTVTSGGNENQLTTFWNTRKFRYSPILAYAHVHANQSTKPKVPTFICAKHLDHKEFSYEFVINKESWVRSTIGTIRVFLAPAVPEFGVKFSMTAQHHLFFLLDIFRVKLIPGTNTIKRSSTESSVTIPWNSSGCGWPHHLLIPKGTAAGMTFDLFVIVTNGLEDEVGAAGEESDGWPLCGSSTFGSKYPDARPMGYPFDRYPYKDSDQKDAGSVVDLMGYINGIANVKVIQLNITHMGDEDDKDEE